MTIRTYQEQVNQAGHAAHQGQRVPPRPLRRLVALRWSAVAGLILAALLIAAPPTAASSTPSRQPATGNPAIRQPAIGNRQSGNPATRQPATRQPAIHATVAGTFWASGFAPGESVAVSWGASNQGTVQADRQGLVSGALAIARRARPGLHLVGLYGLSSHLSLTCVLDTRPHRRAARLRPRRPAPLLLGMLPGPVASVAPPLTHRTVRVPLSAGLLPAGPLLAGLLARRHRKRRRAARRPVKRTAQRRK